MAVQQTFILRPQDFVAERGHCWKIQPDDERFGLHNDPYGVRIDFYEDGKKLGPAQALHDDIRERGAGLYSHWRKDLYLSTSDNSDPRANGREYKVVASRAGETDIDMPQTMHVGITVSCNLTCRICRPDHLHGNTLSDESIENLISGVFPALREVRLDVAGEPTLHPAKFKRLVSAASEHDVAVFMCTNAALIDEDMAAFIVDNPSMKRIQLSFDSNDKERLEWVRRGAKYEDVTAGIRNLVAARAKSGRRDLTFNMHSAVLAQTIDDLPPLVELAADLGVDDVSCMFGFVHSFMEADWSVFWHQQRHNDKIDEAQDMGRKLGIKFSPWGRFETTPPPTPANAAPAQAKPCHYLYQWAYVDPSGGIAPCCISPTFFLGNIKTQSFAEIWHGEAYQELRRTHLSDSPTNPKCASCYIRRGWEHQTYQPYFAPSHWPEVRKRLGLPAED